MTFKLAKTSGLMFHTQPRFFPVLSSEFFHSNLNTKTKTFLQMGSFLLLHTQMKTQGRHLTPTSQRSPYNLK